MDAVRFYQRRGFRLTALRACAENEVRRALKPSLPKIESHGIPMRDELDLEVDLELDLGALPQPEGQG